MGKAARELLDRLAVGPSFLLLGQAFGESGAKADVAISSASDHARLRNPCNSFAEVTRLDRAPRERLFAALREAAQLSPPPMWLSATARYPWNGVFTSAVDQRVAKAFEADWRRVVPSAEAGARPRHPRSITELNVRFLYGGVAMPPDQQPPLDDLDLAVRRREATAALDSLPNGLLTPRGLLAIDGYLPSDWLEPAQLFALVTQLLPGQAHLFSVDRDVAANDFIAGAVQRGALTLHERSLSALLDEAEASGRLMRPASVIDAESRVVRLGGHFVALGRETWNDIIGTARPLDDALLRVGSDVSSSVRYQQFRSFLGTSEGAPPWRAIASGYNFTRDFEDELWNRAQRDVRLPQLPGPLIVTGQAASGKSTALSALAVRVAREGDVAVLHVPRRGDRPRAAAIDRYALWAEEHGAAGTLLIWDGMTDGDEYYTLDRELRSRGRRVLIVGSSYLTRQQFGRRVVAPGTLTESEASRIVLWLNEFLNVDPEDLKAVSANSSFLAALYRLLPETRRGLEQGLTLELRTVESEMERFARRFRAEDNDDGLGIMAAALKRAGIELPAFERSNRDTDTAEVPFGDRTTAERLTAMVLVAGRRNLRVPLDLILRALGREGSATVIETVKQFDIIRWSDDESGDQYLGTRTALEAELLARADLHDVRGEVPVVKMLVSEVLPRPGLGGPEIQFAVDLLDRVGPDSEEGERFKPYYLEITSALKELRATPGRAHPRLMLIEANLTRKWVMWAQAKDSTTPDQRLAALRDAEIVLEEAIELAPSSGRIRLNLLVELAAILGAQAYELSARGVVGGELKRLAERVVENSLQARSLDPENYYPVDVVAWVTLDLTKRGGLSDLERTDLMADSLASLTSVDETILSPQQQAKYHHRRAQFALVMKDDALAAEHLERLAQVDDPAAYFLLALRSSGLLTNDFDPIGAALALGRLREASPEVRADWRCSRLMLDLFWLTKTGTRFMHGERESLAFSAKDWEDSVDLLDRIGGASTFDRYRVDFLRGLALFHLGQLRQAQSVFDVLDRESAGMSRRIIATYLASNPDGTPGKFTGQVRSVTPDGRHGRVWVDQLGIEMHFIPYRFSVERLDRGDALPEFHIAFNMRGPYADPVRTAQPHRRSSRT